MINRLKIFILAVLFLSVIGCAEGVKKLNEVGNIRNLGEINVIGGPKVDLSKATKISNDLYYVPIGRDNDKCMMYRAYSKTVATAQAVIYQNNLGKFSMSKNIDNCL